MVGGSSAGMELLSAHNKKRKATKTGEGKNSKSLKEIRLRDLTMSVVTHAAF
jgi:hypothetical protein